MVGNYQKLGLIMGITSSPAPNIHPPREKSKNNLQGKLQLSLQEFMVYPNRPMLLQGKPTKCLKKKCRFKHKTYKHLPL